eukprot:303852-Rhodomonas_salina.7
MRAMLEWDATSRWYRLSTSSNAGSTTGSAILSVSTGVFVAVYASSTVSDVALGVADLRENLVAASPISVPDSHSDAISVPTTP